jgi:DNA replication protein DnaC
MFDDDDNDCDGDELLEDRTVPRRRDVAPAADDFEDVLARAARAFAKRGTHEASLTAEAARARSLERARLVERRRLLRENGFPLVALDGAMLDQPLDTAALRLARSFAEGRKRVLVLAGGTGAGKTTAATWYALAGASTAPAFVRAGELEARGRYDKELRSWLRSRSMLVIDDIGAEVLDDKGVFGSLLDEIVDAFYGDRKPLIMTTNLRSRLNDGERGEPQFVERYGERIASRLREVGRWGDCGNADLRRRS